MHPNLSPGSTGPIESTALKYYEQGSKYKSFRKLILHNGYIYDNCTDGKGT